MTAATGPDIRMPAEWEPHEATWLAYPHHKGDWPGKLEAARWAFVEFVRVLQDYELVQVLVRNDSEARQFVSKLRRSGGDPEALGIHFCATDRSWLRDSGPTFAFRGESLIAVCWHFDGWGRYPDHRQDALVGAFVARAAGAPVHRLSAQEFGAVEGGAIDCNGNGTFMASEQCALRAHGGTEDRWRTREALERALRDTLGAVKVLWLDRGLQGDDTSGHVDTLARFTGPSTAAAVVETDPRDVNYRALQDNLRRLRLMRVESGRELDIVELPMPRPLYYDGDRLPATYANFYVANGCVLVPTYNDPSDRVALRLLEACFPGREVRGIHCVDVALGLGTLHCLAQQQPQAPERARSQRRALAAQAIMDSELEKTISDSEPS